MNSRIDYVGLSYKALHELEFRMDTDHLFMFVFHQYLIQVPYSYLVCVKNLLIQERRHFGLLSNTFTNSIAILYHIVFICDFKLFCRYNISSKNMYLKYLPLTKVVNRSIQSYNICTTHMHALTDLKAIQDYRRLSLI